MNIEFKIYLKSIDGYENNTKWYKHNIHKCTGLDIEQLLRIKPSKYWRKFNIINYSISNRPILQFFKIGV